MPQRIAGYAVGEDWLAGPGSSRKGSASVSIDKKKRRLAAETFACRRTLFLGYRFPGCSEEVALTE